MPIQAQILALCDRCNSANPFAGARCGVTRVDQVSKSLPITLGLVHSSLSSSCNAAACSPFPESLLQPCPHGLDFSSPAVRFISCSGTFIRTSLLVRDDPSHPAVVPNNDGLRLLYTCLSLRHNREISPHATANSRPHA